MGESLPIRDPQGEHPIATAWRDTLREIVARIVAGDYELSGLDGVQPLAQNVGIDLLRDQVSRYGDVTLIELPDATWQTSVAMWGGSDYWDLLVDLHTVEEGRSDLVLKLRVTETQAGFSYAVDMIYVP